MNKALMVLDHKVPKGSALDKSEHDLAEAMIEHFEAFYKQGVVLKRILEKREYRDANYDSFNEYMDDRQPLGIKRAHAWRLIKTLEIRPLLPELKSPHGDSPWTEYAIRPLGHKDFSKSDVRRIGKKIATRVRKGELLTAPLVQSICDGERGVDRKRQERQGNALDATKTAAETLKAMEDEVNMWLVSLQDVPGDFWSDAESDDRGCTNRLSRKLSELASFLRS